MQHTSLFFGSYFNLYLNKNRQLFHKFSQLLFYGTQASICYSTLIIPYWIAKYRAMGNQPRTKPREVVIIEKLLNDERLLQLFKMAYYKLFT